MKKKTKKTTSKKLVELTDCIYELEKRIVELESAVKQLTEKDMNDEIRTEWATKKALQAMRCLFTGSKIDI